MPQPAPTPTAPLARSNLHADPAIDFCIEVDDLDARLASRRASLRAGVSSASDLSELTADARNARDFIVGGEPEAIELSRPVDPAWIAPPRPRWRAMLARIFR